MAPFVKFLDSARRLIPMGMTRQQIFNFAKQEFGELNELMSKQIDNLFKPKKPVGKKDPDFDNTVEKMQFDDEGKPFNPRNPLKKADGGRIGYAMGGEGIMQMASDPGIMDERNELSIQLFKKPLDLLTPEEMDILNDEAERLMQKFSSAPDPMDERNSMMETIARDSFGKDLKDLSEDEIIQIEEMMDEMSVKPNRGAPSIKLAEGGITRIGLKDGPKDPGKRKFMKAAVGIASMLPFGIGKGVKVAAPVVKKAAEMSEPALAKIVETVMSAGKLISVTGKRVKDMVTKKKLKNVEVEEDIADGSYIIKKDGKEIYYKPGRMDETGGIDDSIIEVIEDTVTKKAGGGIARMLGE